MEVVPNVAYRLRSGGAELRISVERENPRSLKLEKKVKQ